MREIPEAFLTALKERRLKICELFEFTLRNGYTYYYTSHNERLDWGTPSIRYYAAPIKRTSISSSMNLEVDKTSINLAGIPDELYQAARNDQLEGIKVVEKRIWWDQNSAAGMEFIIFVGTGTIHFDRNVLIISCKSVLTALNILIPQNLFQQPCNYSLFDEGCCLNKEDYKESSTASIDAINDYTIIDATFEIPVDDPLKYNAGEIEIRSGDYIGERRNILLTEDGLFTTSSPFPGIIKAETEFDYYPGCDGTPETCRDRFGNIENFYGFVYLPAPEESM